MLNQSTTGKTELAAALLERVCGFYQDADPVCGNGRSSIEIARTLISKATNEALEAIQAKTVVDFRDEYVALLATHLKTCFTCNPLLLEKAGA